MTTSAPARRLGRPAYRQVLDELWAAAHAPRTPGAPTCVSTFAGGGGSSLGYHAAGYRELLAVEWDAHACTCLRRNFPDVHVYEGDIAALDPALLDDLLTAAGHTPGSLALLDGSPPCQGFSLSGGRRLDDPRNQLFREYVRLLRAWQPKVFVMENVTGLAMTSMRQIFREILAELTDSGYTVRVAVLDCSAYGVPTIRKRVLFIGARTDLGLEPSFPQPTHHRAVVTLRQAWQGITDHGPIIYPSGHSETLAPYLEPGRAGKDALSARGGKPSFFNLARLNIDKPGRTLMKDIRSSIGGYLHPSEHRFVSARELCRIQSFPDQYDWADSTYVQIHNRVGNSVPPLLARAVAAHIRQTLLTPEVLAR